MNPDRNERAVHLSITACKALHAKYGIVDEEQKIILQVLLRGEDHALVEQAIRQRRSQETDRKFPMSISC